MQRRDYLKFCGAAGVAGMGAYGVYSTFIRDPPVGTPGEIPDVNLSDTTLPEYSLEDRAGWTLLGITPPSRDFTVLDPVEEWLGRRPAIIGIFIDIGQPEGEIWRLTNSIVESAWNRGHVPHIFWQPFLPSQEDASTEVNRDIAEGEYDDEIQRWADSLAAWVYEDDGDHRRLYLNLAPEFNGDWSPWSPAVGDEDEADFVDMWHHVHDIFTDNGLDSNFVQWIWTLDNTTRGVDREACYPGDSYVDWCGVHAYNWAKREPWQSPEDLYGPTVDFVRGITDKPIALTEFASSSELGGGGHDPERKNDWIEDAFRYIRENDIKMTLYFNLTKETDWAVFGGEHGVETVDIGNRSYPAYPAYRDAVTQEGVLGPRSEHPRILSDEEFAGDF